MTLYKKFLIRSSCLIIVFLGSILVINYYGDPGNQFYRSKKFENEIATHLLLGKQWMVNSNFNERSLQKLMIGNLKTPPEILVFGSSHTHPITHKMIHNNSFYNLSVSSAALQDDIALYYIFQKRGWQPKTVIICLDPWLVDQFSGKEQWKTNLAFEYEEGKKLLLNKDFHFAFIEEISGLSIKYSQLLSFDYLKASIEKLKLSLSSHEEVESNNDAIFKNQKSCPSCIIRTPDGATLPSKNQESRSVKEVENEVMKAINESRINNRISTELSEEYTNLFENFIQYLMQHHVNVILYFPALEPKAYSELVRSDSNYAIVNLSENYFLSIAAKYKLKKISSYNPSKAGLEASDFLDYWHLKQKGARKIFKNEYI